jgi:hypothetical protein
MPCGTDGAFAREGSFDCVAGSLSRTSHFAQDDNLIGVITRGQSLSEMAVLQEWKLRSIRLLRWLSFTLEKLASCATD